MNLLSQYTGVGLTVSRGWKMIIPVSKTINFTKAGYCRLTMVGAGGSGAALSRVNGTGGTGGNSAPWGVKVFQVSAGSSLAITLGAGGAQPAASSNGLPGSTSTAVLNGTTILSAQGGEGGVYRSGAGLVDAPAPSAAIIGADFYVPGVRAGSVTVAAGDYRTGGGAAVDILQTGRGRSPNVTTASTAPGGSVGSDDGSLPSQYLLFEDIGMTSVGVGYGAAAASRVATAFGGGAGNNTSVTYTNAGLGAGGAGGDISSVVGLGGNAYAYLVFEPTE